MSPLRRACCLAATALAGSLLPLAAHADTVDARCDLYAKGADHATRVVPCTFSQRQGFVAIDLGNGVRHELSPQDAPGSYLDEKGRQATRNKGLGKAGQIYRLAEETIYVYWDTAGVPGQATPPANTRGTVLPPASPPPVPFALTLALQGVRFDVSCPNATPGNTLTIRPAGLAIDNSTITEEISGLVTQAEVADLNVDGSPELYVHVRGTAPAAKGTLVAYAANHGKSLSRIPLPVLAEGSPEAQGYRGHDEFAVVESTLVRRFPRYREGDPDTAPGGGVRQLQYKLEPGEASWQLRLDRVVDY